MPVDHLTRLDANVVNRPGPSHWPWNRRFHALCAGRHCKYALRCVPDALLGDTEFAYGDMNDSVGT